MDDALSALITAISLPGAVIALFLTWKSLRQQTIGSDMQTVLTIWDKLGELWVRFRAAKEEVEKEFGFGQLTSYYELACGLFRDRVLTTDAARTLREHLRDILPVMLDHPAFAARFKKLATSPDTFENIRWFVANHAKASTRAAVGPVAPASAKP